MSVPATYEGEHEGCGGTVVFRPITRRRELLAGSTVDLSAVCRQCGATLAVPYSLPSAATGAPAAREGDAAFAWQRAVEPVAAPADLLYLPEQLVETAQQQVAGEVQQQFAQQPVAMAVAAGAEDLQWATTLPAGSNGPAASANGGFQEAGLPAGGADAAATQHAGVPAGPGGSVTDIAQWRGRGDQPAASASLDERPPLMPVAGQPAGAPGPYADEIAERFAAARDAVQRVREELPAVLSTGDAWQAPTFGQQPDGQQQHQPQHQPQAFAAPEQMQAPAVDVAPHAPVAPAEPTYFAPVAPIEPVAYAAPEAAQPAAYAAPEAAQPVAYAPVEVAQPVAVGDVFAQPVAAPEAFAAPAPEAYAPGALTPELLAAMPAAVAEPAVAAPATGLPADATDAFAHVPSPEALAQHQAYAAAPAAPAAVGDETFAGMPQLAPAYADASAEPARGFDWGDGADGDRATGTARNDLAKYALVFLLVCCIGFGAYKAVGAYYQPAAPISSVPTATVPKADPLTTTPATAGTTTPPTGTTAGAKTPAAGAAAPAATPASGLANTGKQAGSTTPPATATLNKPASGADAASNGPFAPQ